jgi:hypothetical protein
MMKKLSVFVLVILALIGPSYAALPGINTIGQGKQPQVSVDNNGTVRVVYGLADKIFCATSLDHGQTFSKPVLAAQVTDMHLGMSRGPQLSSSATCSIITAMDKTGNIHWFKLKNGSKDWQPMGVINDLKGSAPEGLMSITADNKDNFYAVWLDTRLGGKNQVWFSLLSGKSTKWATNKLVYKSPDAHVCECCKPNIAVTGNSVAIMFRNWLNGSRDLYVVRSANAGQTFSDAQKMGLDTWKLNGCPMDGGGIRLNASNQIQTTWQRKGEIYFAQGTDPEVYIGKGKTCSLTGNADQAAIVYQNNDTLRMVTIPDKRSTIIGEGNFVRSIRLSNAQNLFVWEQGDQVKYRLL